MILTFSAKLRIITIKEMKIMEFTKVGTSQLTLLIIGTVIFIAAPLVMAIIWKVKKKDRLRCS